MLAHVKTPPLEAKQSESENITFGRVGWVGLWGLWLIDAEHHTLRERNPNVITKLLLFNSACYYGVFHCFLVIYFSLSS